jgi:hypothetical protein
MSQYEHAHEVPPEEYGQWRADQERARQRANAQVMLDMLNGVGQAEHQGTHEHLARSHNGLFPGSTGQQLAQAAADLPATVGGEWGLGRPLERNGHLAESISPSPARVYLSRINDRPGFQVSDDRPILRHLRGEQ